MFQSNHKIITFLVTLFKKIYYFYVPYYMHILVMKKLCGVQKWENTHIVSNS